MTVKIFVAEPITRGKVKGFSRPTNTITEISSRSLQQTQEIVPLSQGLGLHDLDGTFRYQILPGTENIAKALNRRGIEKIEISDCDPSRTQEIMTRLISGRVIENTEMITTEGMLNISRMEMFQEIKSLLEPGYRHTKWADIESNWKIVSIINASLLLAAGALAIYLDLKGHKLNDEAYTGHIIGQTTNVAFFDKVGEELHGRGLYMMHLANTILNKMPLAVFLSLFTIPTYMLAKLAFCRLVVDNAVNIKRKIEYHIGTSRSYVADLYLAVKTYGLNDGIGKSVQAIPEISQKTEKVLKEQKERIRDINQRYVVENGTKEDLTALLVDGHTQDIREKAFQRIKGNLTRQEILDMAKTIVAHKIGGAEAEEMIYRTGDRDAYILLVAKGTTHDIREKSLSSLIQLMDRADYTGRERYVDLISKIPDDCLLIRAYEAIRDDISHEEFAKIADRMLRSSITAETIKHHNAPCEYIAKALFQLVPHNGEYHSEEEVIAEATGHYETQEVGWNQWNGVDYAEVWVEESSAIIANHDVYEYSAENINYAKNLLASIPEQKRSQIKESLKQFNLPYVRKQLHELI